jgi:mono/diheme cytochrome c family protein
MILRVVVHRAAVIALALNGVATCAPGGEPVKMGSGDALAIFERRILPILKSPRPSSCTECHLSGVELADYIHADQGKTFAALVAGGLIDRQLPAKSKILEFIRRQPAESNLVSQKVRDEELAAFTAWIEAAVKDPSLLAAKPGDDRLGPKVPLEVVRHARRDRVLASFVENIWSEVGRCAACHSPDRNQAQVKKHGEHVSWISLGDPRATLAHLLEAELVDVKEPEKSLLLMKPTEQVKHGGGQKMIVGDRSYRQFRRFLDDYAATVAGKYRSAEQLPKPAAEVSQVSEIWLKIEGVPEKYDKLTLRAEIHRWDPERRQWSDDRWAQGDRAVFGKGRLWQNHLSLVAPRGSPRAADIQRAATLPPGRYLARIYIDADGNLKAKYPYDLGLRERVGEVEFETRWPPGYQRMTVIQFPRTDR